MSEMFSFEVVYALPESCWSKSLVLAAGATVATALAAIDWATPDAPRGIDPGRIAIFSRPARLETVSENLCR